VATALNALFLAVNGGIPFRARRRTVSHWAGVTADGWAFRRPLRAEGDSSTRAVRTGTGDVGTAFANLAQFLEEGAPLPIDAGLGIRHQRG